MSARRCTVRFRVVKPMRQIRHFCAVRSVQCMERRLFFVFKTSVLFYICYLLQNTLIPKQQVCVIWRESYYILLLSELLKVGTGRRNKTRHDHPWRTQLIWRVLANQIKQNRKFQVPWEPWAQGNKGKSNWAQHNMSLSALQSHTAKHTSTHTHAYITQRPHKPSVSRKNEGDIMLNDSWI